MPFAENIKLIVKKKAGFSCCRCHEIGIDVHHIISQKDRGSDDIDNAAPLCQNCHNRYGANPEKRKEIRQMRDWWYEVVAEKYSIGQSDQLEQKLADINEIILKMQSEQINSINSLRQDLISKIEDLKTLSLPNKQDDKNIINRKVSQYVSATTISDKLHANFKCNKCGATIGLLIGLNNCPECKEPVYATKDA